MPSIPDLQRLLEKDPSDPFLLYGLAQEHAKAGDFTRAIAAYDKCLTADPAYCYAYFHKARAQQSAGDLTGAVATVILGQGAARKAGDAHALSELSGLRDELEG
jgi:tetratricopeptide (TPR) repeat protein